MPKDLDRTVYRQVDPLVGGTVGVIRIEPRWGTARSFHVPSAVPDAVMSADGRSKRWSGSYRQHHPAEDRRRELPQPALRILRSET